MSNHNITDGLRLAIKGKSYPSRGMTLGMATDWISVMFSQIGNVDYVIECQNIITNYAEKIYGVKSVGFHRERVILVKLLALKEQNITDKKRIAFEVINIMWEYPENT